MPKTVRRKKWNELMDELTVIDIPETKKCKYLPDTFEVKEIWKGREPIDVEGWE